MLLRKIPTLRRPLVVKIAQCQQGKQCFNWQVTAKCFYSQEIEAKYTDVQKEKILKLINNSDADILSRYEITKSRLKKFSQWKDGNGQVKCLSDVEFIDGFNQKSATKLFDSIVEGTAETKQENQNSKIKGQILQPNISEDVRKNCRTVLAVYVTVNSVCWTLIDKSNYEVLLWEYFGIDYPEGRRFQITDILDISWRVAQSLPLADVYVMKAEATTLRAAGSDPNNPKMLTVNLQNAQMVAMIVALINARSQGDGETQDDCSGNELEQKVYFLRPTLPFRLYGTLVGNERVSTDQTIETILQSSSEKTKDGAKVYISEELQKSFRAQKDLQKDMLGHCLLLGLTFMDVCIYRNQAKINKLLKSGK